LKKPNGRELMNIYFSTMFCHGFPHVECIFSVTPPDECVNVLKSKDK